MCVCVARAGGKEGKQAFAQIKKKLKKILTPGGLKEKPVYINRSDLYFQAPALVPEMLIFAITTPTNG